MGNEITREVVIVPILDILDWPIVNNDINPFKDSIFLSNLFHAYAEIDGTYDWPNSREGDMLKQAKKEIEALLEKNG